MNSKRIYKIIAGASAPHVVHPINDDQLSFTWDKSDDEKIFYERKLKDTLIFSNNSKTGINDFSYFYAYESNATLKCTDFKIQIFKICEGVPILDWQGKFSLSDGDWDLDKCTFKIKPEVDTIYNCVKEQKNLEVNILDVPNIVSTSTNLDFNYEFFYCYDSPFFPSCNLPGVQTGTWQLMYQNLNHGITYQCTSYNLSVKVYYREAVITACIGGTPNPPPGVGWALEQNDCATTQTAKYVRLPVLGPIVNTQFAFGWWNYILNQQELPPEPKSKQVKVTNTPLSETSFFLKDSVIVYGNGGSPVPIITYYFEILNNPNSTYVWSLNPGSPVSALVSGTTSTCLITPNNNNTGIVQLKLTETHGNGHVSTQVYNVQQNVASAGFNQSTVIEIIGQKVVCKNQIVRLRCAKTPINSASGAPVVTPTWTVNNGATILSGQGTDQIVIQAATGNFTATVTWVITGTGAPSYTITGNGSQVVSVADIASSPDLYNIAEVYPTEPQVFYMFFARTGATYDFYRDTTALAPAVVFFDIAIAQDAAPASIGNHCYIMKENVNCGCNFVEVVPATAHGILGMLPAVYWCSSQSNNVTYTRNRTFKEVVEYVIDQLGCGITEVVSDFFEWNPIGDTPGYSAGINYVTGGTNKLVNLLIAQKSDIISYNSSNPATKGLITFEKLEKIWSWMFNAYWFIDGNNRLRVEHVSWFNRNVAYNANALPHAPFNVAKNKWTYDKAKMPKFEKFSFSEMMFSDFIGTAIYYDSICVNQDSANNSLERFLDFLTTDLYALFLDPASANKIGFVLTANNIVGSSYVIDQEVGAISTNLISNGHLSWANLHVAYHKYNRVLKQGYMNNILTTFVTVKQNKIQKDIVIKVCCGDIFNPLSQLYKTQLGNALLDSAEENTEQGIIKLSLLHD